MSHGVNTQRPKLMPVASVVPEVKPLDPVVVHVRCAPYYSHSLRIWPSTFLLDRDSAHTSALVGFENISPYPEWMPVPPGRVHQFTLYFAPMPKSVRVFDLSEIIPEPRGWHFPGIGRNDADVYWLDLPN